MTPDENVAYMEGIAELASRGAEAMAHAMAGYIARRISDDTLRRRRHAPGQYYKARPGDPPAYASGSLADSVTWQLVSAGMRASAVVTSDDKRAGLMEFGGCVLTSHSGSVLKWRDSGRPGQPVRLVVPSPSSSRRDVARAPLRRADCRGGRRRRRADPRCAAFLPLRPVTGR